MSQTHTEKRPYVLNTENGLVYFSSDFGGDPRFAYVTAGFAKAVASGKVPLDRVRLIHQRGGDPEAVIAEEMAAAKKDEEKSAEPPRRNWQRKAAADIPASAVPEP